MNKLNFLSSRRFWSIVIIAFLQGLEGAGIIGVQVANSLTTILGGFVVVTTIDKFRK